MLSWSGCHRRRSDVPRIEYRSINFKEGTLKIIQLANDICSSYAAQGYSLTLRQLYYQFVARGFIRNLMTEYKRLGTIVDDARYAGMLDWNYIVDRTRTMHELAHWGEVDQPGEDSARDFVVAVMPQFRIPKWDNQPTRVEVWIEKDALVDVVARPANGLDLPYFASRGYNSTSNAWRAAQRIEGYYDKGAERVVILHLGDHDPEGIDMSRDIETRFRTFLDGDGYQQGWADMTAGEFNRDSRNPDAPSFELKRIALNMDQVRRYNPPPNPAKETSSRFASYQSRFGNTSWELDALDPPTIDALIRAEVEAIIDRDLWDEAEAKENTGKVLLKATADRWTEVVEFLA